MEERNTTRDAFLEAQFVGEKYYTYYAEKWASHEGGTLFISWNWAAFFLGPIWLLYRKMYLQGAFFVFALFFLEIFAARVLSAAALPLYWFGYADAALRDGLRVLLGVFGNCVYMNHMLGAIMRNKGKSAPEIVDAMVRGGGTNIALAGIVLILISMSS